MVTPFELKIILWDGEQYIPETHKFFNEELVGKVFSFLVPTEDMPSITLSRGGKKLATKVAGIIEVTWKEQHGELTRLKIHGVNKDSMESAEVFGRASYEAGADEVAIYCNGERVKTWRW